MKTYKRFEKPTPQEVEEYARSIGYKIDGTYFCASYEAKGWMYGTTRMKDWKSAVVTWKIRDNKGGGYAPTVRPPQSVPKYSHEKADTERGAVSEANKLFEADLAEINRLPEDRRKEINLRAEATLNGAPRFGRDLLIRSAEVEIYREMKRENKI